MYEKDKKKKRAYIHLGETVPAADGGLKHKAFGAAIFLHRNSLINRSTLCQEVALSRDEEVNKETQEKKRESWHWHPVMKHIKNTIQLTIILINQEYLT